MKFAQTVILLKLGFVSFGVEVIYELAMALLSLSLGDLTDEIYLN